MLRHFPDETIRTQRIASITGNSRRTRVTMFVTTDRRYSFECTAGADGRVLTASWNPPVDTRLASMRVPVRRRALNPASAAARR